MAFFRSPSKSPSSLFTIALYPIAGFAFNFISDFITPIKK